MEKTAVERHLENLLQRFPNYNSWTAANFSALQDNDIRGMLGAFGIQQPDRAKFIPQSFITRYGDAAAFEFNHALLQAATRRGRPALFFEGVISAGIDTIGAAPRNLPIRQDVTGNITLSDGTVRRATPSAMVSYSAAQDIMQVMAQNETARRQGTYTPQTAVTLSIPREAMVAIRSVNPQVSPAVLDHTYTFVTSDEGAYISGYASRMGAANAIGPITMNYQPDQSTCPSIRKAAEIFNTSRPDSDVALSWASGYIQADLDLMTPAARNAATSGCTAARAAARN